MAPLQNREDFVFRTIWNVSYYTVLATATMILYLKLEAHRNSDYQLDAMDMKMVILYWLPFVLSFFAASIFLAVLTYSARYNFSGVHADVLITLFLNVTFCWHKDPRRNLSNLVNAWCTDISTQTILVVFNIVSVFIVAAILCLLLPIALLGAMYSPAEDIRATAMIMQASTITMQLFFHLFCFDYYDYYSLIIVIAALCYIITACIYFGLFHEWMKASFVWNIIETLLLVQMLTIVFVVEYLDDVLYILSVIAFINYLIPNLPLFKLYLFYYFHERISVHRCYRYLMRGNGACVMDKIYCLLHESVHDASYRIMEEHKITESTSLLTASSSSSPQCGHSMQCLKLQYEYLSADKHMKMKILHRMHPRNRYEAFMNLAAVVYLMSSWFAFAYPIWWYFYAWCYLNGYQHENVFVRGHVVNAKSTFVWLSGALYFALSLCWMSKVCIHVFWTLGRERFVRMWRVIPFVWSVKDWECACLDVLDDAETLYQRQATVKSVLDSRLQMDVGLIVLSYIY